MNTRSWGAASLPFVGACALLLASIASASPAVPSRVVASESAVEVEAESERELDVWWPDVVAFSLPKSSNPAGGEWAFDVAPEYRTRFIHIDPLDLAGVQAAKMGWVEHRMRLDVSMARKSWAGVYLQMDLLDGVLFGDNGKFGGEPAVNSGIGLTSKRPNRAGWAVRLRDGGDPLNVDDYVPRLVSVDPLKINFAYGEVMLPFGVLRIGRQPTGEVGSVSLNDGRTGRNRWGASGFHQASDRVLFATKVSEIFEALANTGHKVDPSLGSGVFMGFAYDFLVQDQVFRSSDDLEGLAGQIDWRAENVDLWGLHIDRFRLTTTFSYRWEERYGTEVYGIPLRVNIDTEHLKFSGDVTMVRGTTREISTGFAELTNKTATDQPISALAARASLEAVLGPVSLVAEWAYASGDVDPRPSTPMTAFTWPRDTNLGLMLFEHTLAFQSARTAAVGIENLQKLQSESFPLTEISTEGRVTNVNAFFPQIFYRPTSNVMLKAGALFAWSDVPIVDPILSTLNQDGDEIIDDLVNFNGGKPGDYWGTELDLGLELRINDVFHAIVEGAFLFPGSGLRDENGDAVNSWMVETRLRINL